MVATERRALVSQYDMAVASRGEEAAVAAADAFSGPSNISGLFGTFQQGITSMDMIAVERSAAAQVWQRSRAASAMTVVKPVLDTK